MNENIISDILQAAALAGFQVEEDFGAIHLETLEAGLDNHNQGALPHNYSAVYIFEHNDQIFEVGHCGVNVKPCFQYRHYGVNFPSTLAKSLLADDNYNHLFNENSVGNWIKENCNRYNILIPQGYGNYFRYFVESFLILKLHPLYERQGN